MEFHKFLEILQSKTGKTPRKTGSGYSACCPAHDDDNPSLSVDEGRDNTILLNCFAGCTVTDICTALEVEMSDLFKKPLVASFATKQTIYPYKDEQDRELYRKIRIEPGFAGKAKSFYSERTDEHGRTIRNLNGCRKVLYRLPEVLKGILERAPLFLAEGEKDSDKLAEHGLVSTTSPESLKWSDEFTKIIAAADVILLYDMDATGLKRKELLCQNLYKNVKRLRVIELPGLSYQESHGPDVSDWLTNGHTISELLEIVANTPDYIPSNEKGRMRVVTLGEFLDMKLPEREMLLSPFLPTQGLAMIYAKRGVGKTHVALGIAGAVARGGSFLKWKAPKARKVLFIDGEMPGRALQERLQRIAATDEFDPVACGSLRILTPDLQNDPMPDLATKVGRTAIEEYVEDSDLIVIDNISSLFRSGVENEAESWQPAQDWALELRRRGKSILFVHHAGKGGQQRGSSKREDILDSVLRLQHPSDYRAEEGATFEVVFEKARHFAGEEALSFQVALREKDDGLWHWEITNLQSDPEIATVAELTKQGQTIQEIIGATGLTKAKVEYRQKKARELNLLT